MTSAGHGYGITRVDVIDAYTAVMEASRTAGIEEPRIKAQINELIEAHPASQKFMEQAVRFDMPRNLGGH